MRLERHLRFPTGGISLLVYSFSSPELTLFAIETLKSWRERGGGGRKVDREWGGERER